MQETQKAQGRSLDWEDPLEKEMTIHSNKLAWEIPRTEEPGGLQSMGLQRDIAESPSTILLHTLIYLKNS